jgi:uncharacterized protein
MVNPERNAAARYGSVSRGYAAEIDEGLRAYMLKVYNYMAIGLAVTGVVAFMAANAAIGPNGQLTEFGQAIYLSPLRWVIMLAPLGAVLFLSFRIDRLSVAAAQAVFWGFSAVMGLSLSSIFLIYTGQSITQVFFVTAAAFGSLSLYGYTTKRSLSGMGSFLIMGLFGVIIAMIVNMFMQSSALQFAISVIGVLVFAGLTAYDTQRIKEMYFAGDDAAVMGRKAIMGALALYLDFINMFIMLLQLFGQSRE